MKKQYRISSGLNIMGALCAISGLLLAGYLTFISRDQLILFFSDFSTEKDAGYSILLLDGLALLLTYLVASRYEVSGKIEIDQTFLTLKAFFRKTIRLRLDEIHYIGIDYGIYSGQRHFWVYLSKEPIDKKLYHNMHRLKITQKTIKLEYDQEVYDYLVSALPKSLGKRLNDSYSIIRLYQGRK